jgi:hypothetical protein
VTDALATRGTRDDASSREPTRPANGTAGQLAPAPLDEFRPLDVYAGGLADEAPRLDALATISAGDRGPTREGNKPGLPRRSTDGTIKLHDATGRAPGLRAALEAATPPYKSLTVAFPWDDPALFIQQRFTRYSASALEVYGDERELRVLENGGQRTVPANTPEYRKVLDTCAVSVSVYFMLAEWEPHPAVVLPDGLGFYRLRFTSRNSLRSILNGLRAVGRFTGGRVAGVPFELRIDYREVADRTGQRRTVPVWVLVMRPPATVRLASSNWAGVMQTALSQGQAFKALPPPSEETLALAEWEGPEPDLDEPQQIAAPTDSEIAQLADGGPLDADYWKRRWHAVAAGSSFEDDENRAEFIADFTEGSHASLKRFLEVATEGDCEALIAELQAAVNAERAGATEGMDRGGAAPRGHGSIPEPLEAEYTEVYDGDIPAEYADPIAEDAAAAAEPTAHQAAADQADAQAADAAPPKRWTQKQLNGFFAQVNPLRPRPTPADIHRILGVEHIQEVADLDAALQAIFEAWRREHPTPLQVQQPAGSIEAAWQRYQKARAAAEQWNRENPSAAIRMAPPPPENEATAVQVEAYAKQLESQVARAPQPFASGGGK